MSELTAPAEGDPAVVVARTREDVLVGDELVRHRLSSRVMHWTVAVTFMVTLITGMPIWTPIFGWMAALVGGLHVCRWLHPWSGAAFFAGMLWMFFHWIAPMRFTDDDRKWLSPSQIFKYMMYPAGSDQNVGKYNGGQKLFFFVVVLDAILLFATGFFLWWPRFFPAALREWSIPLHDIAFLAFTVSILGHVYLGTVAFPGTFSAMVRGTVMKAWARLHHPKWYRDVTGDKRS